jgi:hypothetical protein
MQSPLSSSVWRIRRAIWKGDNQALSSAANRSREVVRFGVTGSSSRTLDHDFTFGGKITS